MLSCYWSNFDAFDSWRLHESEIQVQGNQRFLSSRRFATRLHRFAALSLLKKNFWDQGRMGGAFTNEVTLFGVTPLGWKRIDRSLLEYKASEGFSFFYNQTFSVMNRPFYSCVLSYLAFECK